MSKPHAIVIFYNGETPTTAEIKALAELVYNHMSDGSTPTVVTLSEQDMSKILCGKILANKAPKLATEEGDNAAAIVDMFTGSCDRTNKEKLSLLYWKLLVKAEHDNGQSSKNFIKAMSVLSQGNPVSDEYMRLHKITKEMLTVIKTVYPEYAAS